MGEDLEGKARRPMRVLPLAICVIAALLTTVATMFAIRTRGDKLRAYADLSKARNEIAQLEQNLKRDREEQAKAAEQSAKQNKRIQALEMEGQELRRILAEAKEIEGLSRSQLLLSEQNQRSLRLELKKLGEDLAQTRVEATKVPALEQRIDTLEQRLALKSHHDRESLKETPLEEGQARLEVLAVGPDSGFIVTNYGARLGAENRQRLWVRRGTEWLGSALISEVFPELAIAQVEPKDLRSALRRGDAIVLTQKP